jgi:hypothetical protein
MPARKPKSNEMPQFERFIETARQVGADETDEALDRAVRKIASQRRAAAAGSQRGASKKPGA